MIRCCSLNLPCIYIYNNFTFFMLVIVKSFLLNIGPPCGKNIDLFGWVRTKKSLKFGHLQIQV